MCALIITIRHSFRRFIGDRRCILQPNSFHRVKVPHNLIRHTDATPSSDSPFEQVHRRIASNFARIPNWSPIVVQTQRIQLRRCAWMLSECSRSRIVNSHVAFVSLTVYSNNISLEQSQIWNESTCKKTVTAIYWPERSVWVLVATNTLTATQMAFRSMLIAQVRPCQIDNAYQRATWMFYVVRVSTTMKLAQQHGVSHTCTRNRQS